jgi:hypothetical protein
MTTGVLTLATGGLTRRTVQTYTANTAHDRTAQRRLQCTLPLAGGTMTGAGSIYTTTITVSDRLKQHERRRTFRYSSQSCWK